MDGGWDLDLNKIIVPPDVRKTVSPLRFATVIQDRGCFMQRTYANQTVMASAGRAQRRRRFRITH